MYFFYLPLLFFISCINAGDMPINLCNMVVQPPPAQPPQLQPLSAVQRPTVDPNLCADLDPPACSAIFTLEQAGDTLRDQLDR